MQLEKIMDLKNYKILPITSSLGNLSFKYNGPQLFLDYLKVEYPNYFDICSDAIVHKDNLVGLESEIYDLNLELSAEVQKTLESNQFPIIVGGDHSIAMGTWSALATHYQCEENFGLIWIDAHLDMHTIDTSPSGNVHGMPLGYLMGLKEHQFKNILSQKNKLSPQHIVFIGIRDYEKEEWERVEALGIKVYKADEVHEKGFEAVFDEAYHYLDSQVENMGISLDLDAFDPSYTDDVATAVDNGLHPEDVYHSFKQYAGNSKIKALEIVEFAPNDNNDSHTNTNQIIYNLISNFIPS